MKDYRVYPVDISAEDVINYSQKHPMSDMTVYGIHSIYKNMDKLKESYAFFCQYSDPDTLHGIAYVMCGNKVEHAADYLSVMLKSISKKWQGNIDTLFLTPAHYHEFEIAVNTLYEIMKGE